MGHDGARRPTPHQHGRPDVTVPTGPQQPPAPMVVPAFFIRQRITLMVNRYEVVGINPDGSEGALLAFAEQKRMKLKEEVVFYADTSKSRPVFRFKARQRLDAAAEPDVFDEYGNPLGYFRKEFGASLLRSTWTLSTPTLNAVGRERRQSIAILRRVWDFIPYLGAGEVPLVLHVDLVDTATGAAVVTRGREKARRHRDSVTLPDPRVDSRVGAAMALAL